LRENGCNWNGGTCSAAAENGHLSVLQWARENGCPEFIYSEYEDDNSEYEDDDCEDEHS